MREKNRQNAENKQTFRIFQITHILDFNILLKKSKQLKLEINRFRSSIRFSRCSARFTRRIVGFGKRVNRNYINYQNPESAKEPTEVVTVFLTFKTSSTRPILFSRVRHCVFLRIIETRSITPDPGQELSWASHSRVDSVYILFLRPFFLNVTMRLAFTQPFPQSGISA